MNSATKPTSGTARSMARLALAAIAGCLAAGASGAPLSVEFDVKPKAVRLGDMVSATFTISGASDPPVPELPDLPDFRVSSRPSIGTQTVINNGRIQTSRTYTFQMMPTKEGTYRIGPIDYTVNGQRITLPAVELQVAARDAARPGGAQRLDDLLFARLELEDDALYVQENATLLLSVYYADIRLGRDFQLNGLPTSGLSFQSFRDVEGDRELVDGRPYEVRRFRSVIRGLTAGRFTIAPTLTVPVISPQGGSSRRSSSVFDSFFFRDLMATSQPVELSPPPVTVTIQPLPAADRPADFSGAVGVFQFDAQAQPLSVRAGDPVTLTMRISGQGNIDMVSAPPLDLGPDFRLYDARLLTKEIDDSLTFGRKTFEQVVIPRHDGIDALPELSFSYFDPDAGEYRTVRQGPFRLSVSPNERAGERVIQAPAREAPAGDVEVIESDIAYLKDKPGAWRDSRTTPWYWSTGFRALQTLPPLLALATVVVVRRRDGLARDQARSRRTRAARELGHRLERVEAALEQGRHRVFYEQMWQALSGYFGDRLNLPPGSVGGAKVADAFQQAGMPAEQVEQLRQLFDLCEQARYGFGPADESAMSASDRRAAAVIFEKLQTTIRQCEQVKI